MTSNKNYTKIENDLLNGSPLGVGNVCPLTVGDNVIPLTVGDGVVPLTVGAGVKQPILPQRPVFTPNPNDGIDLSGLGDFLKGYQYKETPDVVLNVSDSDAVIQEGIKRLGTKRILKLIPREEIIEHIREEADSKED